jgi:hypothetical protein
MPWSAIAYVSSGLTLIAFIVAVAAWVHSNNILGVERRIKLAPAQDRAALVEQTLEFFRVDTTKLTRAQQYDLAIRQIEGRAQRFRTVARVVTVVAVVAGGVAVYALSRPPIPVRDATIDSLSSIDFVGPARVPGKRRTETNSKGETTYWLNCRPDVSLIAAGNGRVELDKVDLTWSSGGSETRRTFEGFPSAVKAPAKIAGWVSDGGGLGDPEWEFAATRTYHYRSSGSSEIKTATYAYVCY